MKHYFQTTPLDTNQLTLFTSRAKTQTEKVLQIFDQKGPILSPWEVHELWGYCFPLGARRPVITSVRRSMTVLTDRGKLRKLAETKIGPEGAPEHLWQLVKTDEV